MKKPKKIKITPVVEVIFEEKGNPWIPVREVKEYWTLDGVKIGRLDLLDQFPFINSPDSMAKYSEDK